MGRERKRNTTRVLLVCYTGSTRIIFVHLNMAEPIGYCLQCKGPIYVGRSIKKFCNPECKDKYNNAIKIKEQQEIKKVDTALRRNRRALKKLYNAKKPEQLFSREQLIQEGYEFGFLTHIVTTRTNGHELIFCYDYGMREVLKDKYQLYPSFPKVQVKDGRMYEIM